MEQPVCRLREFDLDAFIVQEFGIHRGEARLELVLRVRGILAAYLAKTPLANGQQLHNWLFSLGWAPMPW